MYTNREKTANIPQEDCWQALTNLGAIASFRRFKSQQELAMVAEAFKTLRATMSKHSTIKALQTLEGFAKGTQFISHLDQQKLAQAYDVVRDHVERMNV